MGQWVIVDMKPDGRRRRILLPAVAGEAGPSHVGVALVQTDRRPQGMPARALELDVGAVRALL